MHVELFVFQLFVSKALRLRNGLQALRIQTLRVEGRFVFQLFVWKGDSYSIFSY